MKYFYPLYIKSDIDRISFHDSSVLRPICDEEKLDFFGISNDQRNEDGLIEGYNMTPEKAKLSFDFISLTWSNRYLTISANLVFETPNKRKDAESFNKALKLLKPGWSGVSIGFNDQSPALEFMYPNPFYRKHVLYSLVANSSEVVRLKALYTAIKCISDPKFDLVIEKFIWAISGENIRLENRFIDLMTILEILVLPERKREIKRRLSGRIGNMLTKHCNKEASIIEDFTEDDVGLYSIRSAIVHNGESEHLNDKRFFQLENYTRSMLNLYLDNPQEFIEEKLIRYD